MHQLEMASRASGRASEFLARPCPGCGGHEAAPNLEIGSKPPAESRPAQDVIDTIDNAFFSDRVFFSYSRCPQCRLLYCPLYFDQEQLQRVYGRRSDNTFGLSIAALQKTQRGYFRLLKKFSSLRGGYLEVGPDIGLFTQYSAAEGQFDKYWLFEPNRAVWDVLAKQVEGKNFELVPEMFNFGMVPDGAISTAVIVHVLDHLLAPLDTLLKIRRKLAPGATLLIVTHDEGSLLARIAGRRWPAYSPFHPQLFRPATITALLQTAGFKVQAIRKSANHFPVTHLARHALWVFAALRIRLPEWPWLHLPVKLGNIITIATPG